MALFKKGNDNNMSRAVDIIKSIKPQSSQDPNEPAAAPQDPPAEPSNPPVDPKANVQPPAEPPVEPQDPPSDPPQSPTEEPQDPTAGPPPSDPQHNEPQNPPSDPPADPQPTPVELSEESVMNFLSERLNKPVTSLDDLKTPPVPELDPELKQLQEWKEKTGLSLSQWADYNKDFSKMEDLDVVREIRSQKYPNLSDEELEFLMRDVTFNPDVDDDTAKMEKSVKLKTLAADGRDKLEANRLNLRPNTSLTQEQQADLELARQVKEQQEAAKANNASYIQNLNKAALSLNAVNMQLSEDLNLKYDVPEGDRKSLPKLVTDMPHWYNKDGSVNHEAIVKDALIIREFPKMIKKAYEQGVSVGIEGKIRKDKNIPGDPGKEPMGPDGKPKKGNINDVVDNIAGGNRGMNKRRFMPKPQN